MKEESAGIRGTGKLKTKSIRDRPLKPAGCRVDLCQRYRLTGIEDQDEIFPHLCKFKDIPERV